MCLAVGLIPNHLGRVGSLPELQSLLMDLFDLDNRADHSRGPLASLEDLVPVGFAFRGVYAVRYLDPALSRGRVDMGRRLERGGIVERAT